MALTRAAELAIAGGEQTLLRGCATLDAAALTRAACDGDRLSRRLLAEAGEHLGRGVAFLLNILNPEMVVLAGPYVAAGEVILGPLRDSVARHAIRPQGVAIVSSTLDTRAVMIGAVLMVMDQSTRSYRIVGGPSAARQS
jgi:predicted NBD/HSP70 family sugar kinase